MKIVIDIPEEEYNAICKDYIAVHACPFLLGNAIKNGTPLPKGHARLKDVDHYIKMEWEHPDYSLTDDEPTIIEADKAESEEQA